MKLKKSILKSFCRTAIYTISILSISIGFSFGGALAENCQGGAVCPVCTERPHGHVPGAAADMENPGCPSGGQNATCGFVAGQDPDEFRGIISAVRSYHQVHAGIFAAVSDEYCQTFLPKEFTPQFLLSDSGGTAPIYLLNQALLC
jgi:hypothetical protein